MPEELSQLDNRVRNLETIGENLYDVRIRKVVKDTQKGIILKRRITMSSAQIRALNSSALTIVPAYILSLIIIEGITARLNFNATAYTGANNLEFRYTNGSGAKVTADMANTFINSGSTAYNHVSGVATAVTPVLNTPIVAVVPTADPGTGDSTMDLFIEYRIVIF